jgi:hypothetical protein
VKLPMFADGGVFDIPGLAKDQQLPLSFFNGQ